MLDKLRALWFNTCIGSPITKGTVQAMTKTTTLIHPLITKPVYFDSARAFDSSPSIRMLLMEHFDGLRDVLFTKMYRIPPSVLNINLTNLCEDGEHDRCPSFGDKYHDSGSFTCKCLCHYAGGAS